MPKWIMSSRVKTDPVRTFEYFIGNVLIVKFRFQQIGGQWEVAATYHDDTYYHKSMSDAMKVMHQRLGGPAPEGAEVRAFEKKEKVGV